MPALRFQRVSILGVGLIGGSIALALRDRGLADEVTGFARSENAHQRLTAWGGLDRVASTVRETVEGADLVVVASPVESVAPLVTEAAGHCPDSALITDAGSTKKQIVDSLLGPLETGEGGPCFIGSHPIAGDHRTGADAGRADLFVDAKVVVTPTQGSPDDQIERLSGFWQSIGATVENLTPEEHDRLLAGASHLPHVAAAALAASTPEDAFRLAASGWADTTRVAAGSPALWREILLSNRDSVLSGLKGLKEELQSYEEALTTSDGDELQRLLEQGRLRRDALGS